MFVSEDMIAKEYSFLLVSHIHCVLEGLPYFVGSTNFGETVIRTV